MTQVSSDGNKKKCAVDDSEPKTGTARFAPSFRVEDLREAEITASVGHLRSKRVFRASVSFATVFSISFAISFFNEIQHGYPWQTKLESAPQETALLASGMISPALSPINESFRGPQPGVRIGPSMTKTQAQIKVVDASWVDATADEKTVFRALLRKDEVKIFTFAHSAILRVGNAGGIELALDGKPIGPLGNRGKRGLVEINSNGIRNLPWNQGRR
jgi:hypothetical protein